MAFEVRVTGVDEIKKFLDALPKDTFDVVKQEFIDRTLAVHKTVSDKFNGVRLTSRTGALRRSFKTKVTGTNLENLDARVFSGSSSGEPIVYAPIHEFGGTINAKRAYKNVPGGPYLNIPLGENKTAAGVMRFSAREVFSQGGFLLFSKNSNWVVMSKDFKPMFVLKKSVSIPPRLGFFSSGDREAARILPRLSLKLPEAWGKI